ncbi:MAG: SoxR reducing system RseC family protein [Chitinivibrionales bacterium]|nr:SoxR reducing system RseC family protein [Chitinivibrionales bacterium]
MHPFLGSKKREKAVVTSVTSRGVYITLQKECRESGGCKGGCGLCGTDEGKKNPRMYCAHLHPNRFATGQKVVVEYMGINEAVSALILFGIPLVALMVAILVVSGNSPGAAESPSAILTILGSFIGGFIIVAAIEKTIKKIFPVTIHDTIAS